MAGPAGRFAALLGRRGAWPQSGFGLLGRAPGSMLSVGFVAAASAAGGTSGYALGGLAAGVFALAGALGGPAIGRLADRRGQRGIGRGFAIVSAAAALLAAASLVAWGVTPAIVVLAAISGLTLPNVSAFARVRWAELLHESDEATTAQAWESIIDETAFLVWPPLVAILIGVWFNGFPIALAAAFLLVGAFGTTSRFVLPLPRPHPAAPAFRLRGSFPTGPGLLVSVLILGTALGAVQVIQIAYCAWLGLPEGAALVFLVNSGASLVGAIVVGGMAVRMPARRRFTMALLVYAIGVVPSVLVNGYLPFVLASVVSGVAIAPAFVQANAVVADEAPPAGRTAAFALIVSAVNIGIALGAAMAGSTVTAVGPDAARSLLLGLGGACAVAAVLADLAHRHMRGGQHAPVTGPAGD